MENQPNYQAYVRVSRQNGRPPAETINLLSEDNEEQLRATNAFVQSYQQSFGGTSLPPQISATSSDPTTGESTTMEFTFDREDKPEEERSKTAELDRVHYSNALTLQKAKIFAKIKEETNATYANNVIVLFNHLRPTLTQVVHIAKMEKILFNDANKYKGTTLHDHGPPASPYCKGEFRQGVPQARRVWQHVPTLVNATIDGPNESYYSVVRGNGNVQNAHLHTSVLKRYMSALIKRLGYDAYSLIGQQWLNNTVEAGPVILTGAFINSTLENYAPQLAKLKIPIMAVVQQYTPGLHLGDEYSYICDADGCVLGTSNEGSHDFWTDKNLDLPFSGAWRGMNVHTLMELGPQRLVFINHTDPPEPAYRKLARPDNTYQIKHINSVSLTQPHLLIGLYDQEEEEARTDYAIPGFDPFLAYTCASTQALPIWSRALLFAKRLWRNTWVYSMYTTLLETLGVEAPDHRIVLNPNLCRFPDDAKDLTQLYYANPIDPITHLPYGVYKISGKSIIQLHFGDNSANYTNLYTLFRAYATRRGHSPASTYKYLIDYTANLHPLIVPDCDFAFQPTFESPLKPITARRPYKVEVIERPGYSVKLFSEDELREYIVNYVTSRSVSAAASWRVVRAGLRSIMPKGAMLSEYREFWMNGVCGGKFDMVGPVDPIPDVTHFIGKKRRKYELLLQTIGTRSMRAHYSLFCKMEALPLKNVLNKAVRIISPNNPSYNLRVLMFFTEFEHRLLQARSPCGTHLFAKSLNYEQRWATIRILAQKFKLCYSIDFKNFDAHHCDDNYEQEIRFYEMLGLEFRAARELLECRHTGVISYKALMRCSGDLFTGSGNCLTVGTLLFPYVGKDLCFFCDGDDTLLFMNDRAQYASIVEHLYNRGYELGEPEIVDCCSMMAGSLDYTIPFCQVMYRHDYYYKDLDRLLNKTGNLAGATLDYLSRAILGKLQSLPVLKTHGHEFNIDITKFLNGIDDNYELDYKKMLSEQMIHYQAVAPRHFDLKNGTSLLAKIARSFEYNKFRIYLTRVSNRPKLLRRLIKQVLSDELDRATSMTPDLTTLTRKVAHVVRDEGPASLVPVLTCIYRDLIREQGTHTVIPPLIPKQPSTVLVKNSTIYV